MQANLRTTRITFVALVLAVAGAPVPAQPPVRPSQSDAMIATLPDAPVPQADAELVPPALIADAEFAEDPTQDPAPAPAKGQTSPQAGRSTSQPAAPSASTQGTTTEQQPPAEKSQHQTAEEQLKAQEKQRILGIVPYFGTTYVSNAASLTSGQKMKLAFRSAIDPFTFAGAFIVAGLREANGQNKGFGWGAEGYFKLSGAAYLDAFNGNMIGNGILPSIFRQDPRYFRLGHGTIRHRVLYAMASAVICKHDNTGKWEPNYSNVGGNIAAGAISNLYYPSTNSGWGQTISTGLIVTAEGMVGGVFQEFWPDLSRKFLHQDPTHGQDAQAATRDKAQKQEEEQKPEDAPK